MFVLLLEWAAEILEEIVRGHLEVSQNTLDISRGGVLSKSNE